MLDKTLRFLYYSLFFVTPLLVLPATSELFEFNKMLLIYFIASSASFIWLLNSLLSGKWTFKKTYLALPIMLFLISQILSTVFSIDTHTSLFGYYGRFNGGLISIIAYFALFYIFVLSFKKEFIEKLLKTSLLSSVLVILWGLPGKFGHDMSCLLFLGQWNNSCWSDQFRPAERMFSTLGQPNWLGAYLAINFFIGLYFLIRNSSFARSHSRSSETVGLNDVAPHPGKDLGFESLAKSEFLSLTYLIFNFVAILFTRSRSAYLAIAIGMIVFFGFLWKVRREMFGKLRLVFLSFLVAILIFKTGVASIDKIFNFQFLVSKQNSKLVNSSTRQRSFSTDVTESGDIRKIVWKGAIDLGLKYPLFGTGVETFAYSYYFVRPQAHNLTSEWDFLYNKAHNEYLNYLATTGFIGLLIYLLFVGSVVFNFQFSIFKKNTNSNEEILKICLLTAYITILVTNFFGFSTTTINIFFYLIPAFMIVYFDDFKGVKTFEFRKGKMTLLALSTAVTFYIFLFLLNYFRADLAYAKGESYFGAGDYPSAVLNLDHAVKQHYEHVYQDKLSIAFANLAYLSSYEKNNNAQKLIKASKLFNQLSLNASPQNILYWKTRAKNDYIYFEINRDEKELNDAVSVLTVARGISPTDPKVFYTIAVMYSLLEDREKDSDKRIVLQDNALAAATRALILKVDYRDGYLLRSQLFKKYGKRDQAVVDLQYILKNINSHDQEAQKELKSL